MKKLLALVSLSVFLMIFCGAIEKGTKTEMKPAEELNVVSVAYEKLSEPELQKFIKVYPVFKEEADKAGKKIEQEEINDLENMLGQYAIINKEIPGLDVKLKAAGMAWSEFWPAFAKTIMAYIAVEFEEGSEKMEENLKMIEEQLNNPDLPDEAKKSMKEGKEKIEQLMVLIKKVPQGNKDLVMKHKEDIDKMMEVNVEVVKMGDVSNKI